MGLSSLLNTSQDRLLKQGLQLGRRFGSDLPSPPNYKSMVINFKTFDKVMYFWIEPKHLSIMLLPSKQLKWVNDIQLGLCTCNRSQYVI